MTDFVLEVDIVDKVKANDIIDLGHYSLYRKKKLARAVRINGPFRVETRDGLLHCNDGYLAFDSDGWPYPIAKEEFEKIYEKAD